MENGVDKCGRAVPSFRVGWRDVPCKFLLAQKAQRGIDPDSVESFSGNAAPPAVSDSISTVQYSRCYLTPQLCNLTRVRSTFCREGGISVCLWTICLRTISSLRLNAPAFAGFSAMSPSLQCGYRNPSITSRSKMGRETLSGCGNSCLV